LELINTTWRLDVLDTATPFIRDTQFWYPFYLFLLLFVVYNFGAKGWWWVLAVLLTAALADILSSQIIKEQVQRLRPCRDPAVAHTIRFFVNYCPKSSSFTSSHATSHFAQAMFFFQTFRAFRPWTYLFFVWAFLIAYSQVYVAVHYPLDVFCGGLIGLLLGGGMAKMYHKRAGFLIFNKE
jgi:undecaprenyl-diphosphatase